MSEECTHDCSTCSSNCGSKDPKSLLVAPHPNSKIGKVIGVVSGKGGVGKSMVTDLLAVNLRAADTTAVSWMPILPVLRFRRHLVSPKKLREMKQRFSL